MRGNPDGSPQLHIQYENTLRLTALDDGSFLAQATTDELRQHAGTGNVIQRVISRSAPDRAALHRVVDSWCDRYSDLALGPEDGVVVPGVPPGRGGGHLE